MSITVAIEHVTTYDYDRPVRPNPHLIRLRPTAHCRTPILSYSLRISPADHYLHWQQDPYNNWVARMNFERGRAVNQLRFQVEVIAEMIKVNPFDFRIDASAATYPFTYEEQLARELSVYREVSPADAASPLVQHLADEVWANDIRTVDHIVEVNRRVNQRLGQGYTIRLETGVQSPHETLQRGRGSCRDFAWLMCILLRRLGYAARFVSGYSVQLVPDLDDPLFRLSRDVVDLHAWTEVYLPGAGWVGLDATNGALCEAGHIPLAATADPGQAAPITGSFSFDARPGHPDDQVEAKAQFSVTVTRLAEAPRVTRPYSPQQWEAIDAAGLQIDTQLSEMDVRLTMGGEPTFVALDDMDAPEWNIAAVGPTKRLYAGDLLRRLHERFTNSQGLMFFGQGKWYPGESLPRWSLSCWWRSDGQPVWQDPTLTADERAPGTHDRQAAERLMAAITTRLGVEAKAALPGYEDVWYYLHRERRLPVNVDPLEARLDDPQERRRLAEVLRQGLGQVVGYALPLRRLRGPFAGTAGGWQTGRWFLRDEHLYLMPGDSPMGFRLPLDSLPWQPPDEIETYGPVDPFAPRDPLPPPGGRRLGLGEDPRRAIDPSRWPGPGDPRPQFPGLVDPARRRRGVGSGPESEWESLDQPWYATVTDPFAGEVIRTALCVEPRRGHLYVFVPPQRCAEDFLDLIAAIEQAAADTALPVFIEGYEPPGDPRLRHFRITPDPGVIEVNIHPSADWGDLREKTRILYQEARAVGLGTEKFMLDGRHAGTGGGNHVTLGGATAADSPILRRPDVLASLVTYWNHHPSLSYLFSTLFVGPTSQSPRLDEARHDSLHELEIALRQLPNVASTARDGAGSVGTPPRLPGW